MSREIKFRAWDKEQKKMFYGVSIGTIKVWDENAPIISHEFAYSEDCIFEQYTGLKDKNGKEIYEGDIIKDTSDGDCLINAVFWCEKGGFWGVKPRSPFAERGWGWFICRDDIEVIGNIHENPELLEAK